MFQFANAVTLSTLTSAHKLSVTQVQIRLVTVITALRRGPTGTLVSPVMCLQTGTVRGWSAMRKLESAS